MTLKRKTAKQAATAVKALPGKRRTAAKGAKAGTRAVRRNPRVQALLHNPAVHERLQDGLRSGRIVYLRATRRGDAVEALLDDRKGRRALRRMITSFREAVATVRDAKPRRRPSAATRVAVAAMMVGGAGALAGSKTLRKKVLGPAPGSDSTSSVTASSAPSDRSPSADPAPPAGATDHDAG